MSEKTLLKLNKLFRCPQHPFNTQASGGMSYAEWQFSRAEETLRLFEPEFGLQEILGGGETGQPQKVLNSGKPGQLPGKAVLDLGCGAAGKSVWYASKGACVTAVDTVSEYQKDAEELARTKGIARMNENGIACTGTKDIANTDVYIPGSFRFICADAADTGLPDASFDSIIMSDAMEHFADPEAVLAECARLLRPGGRVFISFPPYGHPYGAHVSDLIGIPWAQLFFSDNDIIAAYRTLAEPLPDGEKRVNLRFSKVSGAQGTQTAEDGNSPAGGSWRMTYINKMTLRRFKEILSRVSGNSFRTLLYREVPLRRWLTPLAKLPGTKEHFVRMAVCVLERT